MKKLCLSLSAFLLLTITSMAQNVGIGTNNPASKLDVTGNLSIGSTFSGTAAPSNGAIIEGQVGIGTDTVLPGAALQVNSTDKGFLPPRIVLSSTLVSAPIANPTNGLLIFNTATNGAGPTAVTPGFYYWDTNHWERVNTGASTGSTGATGAQGPTGAAGPTGATGQDGQSELYATTSSNTLGTANSTVTITVGTGLSYTTGQTIVAANSATRYKIGTVGSYNPTTGSMTVTFTSNQGTGNASSWAVNLNGASQGAAGATGATGATGAAGAAGVTGATGSGYAATSTSSVLIGTGSKTFTTQAGLAYVTGLRVRVANSGTNYMEGTVTSYSGTSLVVNVDRVAGSGTLASWNIGIAGDVGAAGSTGAAGPTGATGATGVTASLLVSAARTTTYTATVAFNTLVYNTASVNVGGAYNTTTGEFTAPATGLYQVIVSNNYTVLNGLNNGLNGRVVINGTTDYESSIAMTPYNTTTIASALVMNDIVSMTSGQKLTIAIGNLVNTMNPSVGTGQHLLKIIRLN